MTTVSNEYLAIGDYALLSDCHSSALVSRDASIDWACLRRFDAGSTFARILDHERGGHFAITPRDEITSRSRRYLEHTMVLETILTTAQGSIVVTDAFAMQEGGSDSPMNGLVRHVRCTVGDVDLDIVVEPRFDYGGSRPWLRIHGSGVASAVAGDDAIVLHAGLPLQIERDACRIVGSARLLAGQELTIVMVSQPAHRFDATPVVDAESLLPRTVDWWARWSEQTVAEGPYAAVLDRSALVLKALSCAPTGAIIAAPTTSLPEIVGGSANWDYRYCWVRDATLTLAALSAVGHHEVADGFRTFLMRSAAGHGEELQIMYGAYGQRRLPEVELDLAGWRGSSPVRVGNGAAQQTQLDMYGHVLDAVHVWHRTEHDITDDEWTFLSSLVDLACDRWRERDAGIWEIRGEPRDFVHSKAMVWVAIDGGIRLATEQGFEGADLERWRTTRDELRAAIDSRGVHPVGGYFVQSFGSNEVDASLLQLALSGFVDVNDPRMIATVAAIRAQLGTPDGFLRRYRRDGETVDGDAEGVFLLCTCWLVQVLARQGQIDEATAIFERIVALGNDVGLFAEEYDLVHGEFLGNFPQAFTHLGLIAAAECLRTGGG
ncbi:MAG: glycoside hydrolase 15-related protein [Ilumatobacteraceae bacterium]|nr:glycoside hydrolase 15-related protein [Ilumatobacteraceae bacterium]